MALDDAATGHDQASRIGPESPQRSRRFDDECSRISPIRTGDVAQTLNRVHSGTLHGRALRATVAPRG